MEALEAISNTMADIYSSSPLPFDLGGFQDNILWVLVLGFIIAFILAAGVGANDVANTFGTSVGSGVITLRNACILATIFEMLGASLIGYKVSDTIRKGIVDVAVYADDPESYMQGNLAALGGSAIWLILATFLNMPISGTHSIVGSVLGFSLVLKGTAGIKWIKVGQIVGSWFLSPVLSGLVSGSIFWLISRLIINKEDAIRIGLRSLPIFYGVTVFVNIISVALDGPEFLKVNIDGQSWFEPFFGVMISAVLGLVVAVLVYFVLVPRLTKSIEEELTQGPAPAITTSTTTPSNNSGDVVVFVIGNGNVTPDDSKEQVPMNISMKDFRAAEKSLEAGLKVNGGNGFIRTNDFVEPNHNEDRKVTDKNLRNNGYHNHEAAHPVSLEVVPVDGLSPNGSAVPLIKSGTGTTMSSSENGASVIQINGEDGGVDVTKDEGDKPGVGKLFSALQVLTAAFGSFAHGGNDVSNAIGPLIALFLVYNDGNVETKAQTPIYILIYGGIGISLGLWIWGRRVIKTMGEDLTKITPSSGFTIEIGAAITVLLASKIGLPVSTTHCKVGSVVTVGQIRTRGGVDWKLFRNIFFAWIVTVPVSGGLSALLVLIIRAVA